MLKEMRRIRSMGFILLVINSHFEIKKLDQHASLALFLLDKMKQVAFQDLASST